jgi:hypothetical protein
MSGPSPVEALSQAIGGSTAAIHTSAPGVVTAYDRVTQTCSVTPAVKLGKRKPDGSIARVAPPGLHNVPVLFPGSGDISITWDLQAGDEVLLLFAERSIAEWRSAGGTGAEPLDPRRHDIQDAVAIPGLRSAGKAIAAAGLDEGALVVLAEDIRLGSKDAASALVLEELLPDLGAVATALSAWATAPAAPTLLALTTAITTLLAGISGGGYKAAKVTAE